LIYKQEFSRTKDGGGAPATLVLNSFGIAIFWINKGSLVIMATLWIAY